MKNATIRQFDGGDAEGVRAVCAAADSHFSPAQRDILLTLYCNYYIEQEPEHCLVLADDNDHAVGYCIAASDWFQYKTRYNAIYLPLLRQCGGRGQVWRKRVEMSHLDQFAADYPAHLHIDLLEDWRGSGYGTKLLASMAELLADEGVCGVMLGVGDTNTGARRFYARFGFSEIGKMPGCVYYGYPILNKLIGRQDENERGQMPR